MTIDADIRIAILRSSKLMEITDTTVVKYAIDTAIAAQDEGYDFDTAYELAREVLVRATLSAA
jgi:hypothetical protein